MRRRCVPAQSWTGSAISPAKVVTRDPATAKATPVSRTSHGDSSTGKAQYQALPRLSPSRKSRTAVEWARISASGPAREITPGVARLNSSQPPASTMIEVVISDTALRVSARAAASRRTATDGVLGPMPDASRSATRRIRSAAITRPMSDGKKTRRAPSQAPARLAPRRGSAQASSRVSRKTGDSITLTGARNRSQPSAARCRRRLPRGPYRSRTKRVTASLRRRSTSSVRVAGTRAGSYRGRHGISGVRTPN